MKNHEKLNLLEKMTGDVSWAEWTVASKVHDSYLHNLLVAVGSEIKERFHLAVKLYEARPEDFEPSRMDGLHRHSVGYLRENTEAWKIDKESSETPVETPKPKPVELSEGDRMMAFFAYKPDPIVLTPREDAPYETTQEQIAECKAKVDGAVDMSSYIVSIKLNGVDIKIGDPVSLEPGRVYIGS